MKPSRARLALILAALILTAVVLGTHTAPSVASPSDHQALNLHVTDELIVPGYRALAAATARFQATTATGCGDLDALQNTFHAVGDAWSNVELWRFGPINYLDRRDRIWFWPDKHDRMARQLRDLLADADRAMLGDAFPDLSAALEGMPAAERMLFTPLAASLRDADGYPCAYLRAIARNLNAIAEHLVQDWTDAEGQRAQLAAITDGHSPLYESAAEYTTLLLNSLHTELLAIRDLKLDRPLGVSLDQAHPRRAELWRSERGLRNIQRNLKSVRTLFEALTPAITDAALTTRIRADFEAAATALNAIPGALADAVAEPTRRPQVEAARAAIHVLAEGIGKDLPPALGLSLGFNSLDGD